MLHQNLLSLAALALSVSASPVPAAADSCARPASCPSYTIINARGTTEPQGESVGFTTMNKKVLDTLGGGKIYNVVYPADWTLKAEVGTADILKFVKETLAKNPSECLILEGYSQGAMAVVGALKEFTADQSAAVKGVFVIGNPRHKPGLACNVDLHGGDSTRDAVGFLYDKKQFIPDSYVGRTMDVCNFGDGVCDKSHGLGVNAEHLAYPGDAQMQDMGAKFVLSKLA
ncbi:hypothetical protein VHEMI07659 [[Torrubiella] hemipterigena]|uniref:Cutinase n=1 Tax=[Torrubiella] hemipterigena TaxID=1531966 RepID=A0A0A1TM11_9HYPO|nr:hypothetical protein VHEMI07659 [[Torrubiella] hemipterigena]